MKTINNKQLNRSVKFLALSGLGAVWLSFWWMRMTLNSHDGLASGNFETVGVLIYYMFNSILLIVCAGFLQKKNFKIFSYFSVILCLTVSMSLLIFTNGSNLFIYTTIMGMTFGITVGGIILVPLFLVSVYLGAYKAYLYLNKKLIYIDDNSVVTNH